MQQEELHFKKGRQNQSVQDTNTLNHSQEYDGLEPKCIGFDIQSAYSKLERKRGVPASLQSYSVDEDSQEEIKRYNLRLKVKATSKMFGYQPMSQVLKRQASHLFQHSPLSGDGINSPLKKSMSEVTHLNPFQKSLELALKESHFDPMKSPLNVNSR